MTGTTNGPTRTYNVYGRNGAKVVVECAPRELRGEIEALIRRLRGIEQVTARTTHNPDASVNRGLWWESPGPAALHERPWSAGLGRPRTALPRRVGPDGERTTG